MTSEELKKYIMTQLVLTYRLSLETTSKLFNESEQDVYDFLTERKNRSDEEVVNAIKYVFNYETRNESDEIQKIANKNAKLFLLKLHMAKTNDDKIKILKSINNDADVLNLRTKKTYELSDYDFERISRYRLKYALTKSTIYSNFYISKEALNKRESSYENEILKNKLSLLNAYKSDIHIISGKTPKR